MRSFKIELGICSSFSAAEPWIRFCISLPSHTVSVLDNTEAALCSVNGARCRQQRLSELEPLDSSKAHTGYRIPDVAPYKASSLF